MSEDATDPAGGSDATDGGLDAAEQRRAVRDRYSAIATADAETAGGDATDGVGSSGCCGPDAGTAGDGDSGSSACCDTDATDRADDEEYAATLGYTDDDVAAVAEGANLGLGCGNPTAIAGLEAGETVLDLGSGGGFDCFLAAREVGDSGRVIGVDMTPEMVEKARANVERNDADNVEFRLGEIEHLPVADETVDVVISNCVVNLSPDKPRVYREAFRALRPGGRVSISDVVLTAPVPEDLRGDPTSVASCVAGAAPAGEVESMLEAAGFEDVAVELEADSDTVVSEWDDERDLSEFVRSAQITGRKPERRGREPASSRRDGEPL